MTITLEAYGKEFSVKLDEEATWKEAVKDFISLLNASGYIIKYDNFKEFVDEELEID